MENIFEEKICLVCKKYNTDKCPKIIQKEVRRDSSITFCTSYLKDSSKVKPYKKPLLVTAKRDYVNNVER